MNAIEYNNRLVQTIRPVFETFINPLNIVYVFHHYDLGVLVTKDIQAVKACCSSMGGMEGANLLLDRISLYNNWFECLLKVLRDPHVKLPHVADAFTNLKEKLDQEFNTALREEAEPIQELWDTLQNNQMITFNPILGKDNPPEEPELDNEYIEPTDYDPREDNQRERPRTIKRLLKRSKVISELPERDFTEEEVNVLRTFPGWHAGIDTKQVFKLLNPHRRQAGSYIIWHWKDKKRPVISVTHNNKVKTLLVHKRPDPADNKKVDFYFINKDEKTCNSLKEIVEHHISNGVFVLSEKPHIIRIFFNQAV